MSDECGCVYTNSGDYDSPTFESTTWRTARKPHKCAECGDMISSGALYEYISGRWDGTFVTVKTCAACQEVRVSLCCDGWVYGRLWEDVRAYFQEGGKITGCLAQLETAAAKEKLAEEFREYHGLTL